LFYYYYFFFSFLLLQHPKRTYFFFFMYKVNDKVRWGVWLGWVPFSTYIRKLGQYNPSRLRSKNFPFQ
jgi:hypothetical protein